MKKRNIAVCVILTIVTLGIYGLYWFVKITNDVNELANPEKKSSGADGQRQAGTEPRRCVSDSGADHRPCWLDPDAEHDQFHD